MIDSLDIGLLGIKKLFSVSALWNYCISRPTSNLGFFIIVASHILCASALALAAAFFRRVCASSLNRPRRVRGKQSKQS
jgi:hypothetical protein